MRKKDEADIRVAMIVTGFPNSEQPSSGIFNLQAAKALRQTVDLSVVHLRAWKPGRQWVHRSHVDGVPVTTVTVPQIPRCEKLNLALYRSLGWSRIRPLLSACDLLHSVDAAFAGVLSSSWGCWARVRHVTQLTGGETTSIFPRMRTSRYVTGWEDHLHGVACNSQKLLNEFLNLYPGVRNLQVTYRGADLQRFHPIGPAEGPLVNSKPVRFLFLGGFPPYPQLIHGSNTKGGETLLKVWKEAEADLISSEASLLIAGPGSQDERISRWRESLHDPSRVHLAGLLDPGAVPAYIRSSDVVLVPSMEEGLPNVAVEASACGRPVFGSDTGGIPEVIEDGKTGLVLPPGDVGAWSSALRSYARHASQLRMMGEVARRRVELFFDSKGFGKRMLELYGTALNEPVQLEKRRTIQSSRRDHEG